MKLKTSTRSHSIPPAPTPEHCPPGRTQKAYPGKSDDTNGKELKIWKLAHSDYPNEALGEQAPLMHSEHSISFIITTLHLMGQPSHLRKVTMQDKPQQTKASWKKRKKTTSNKQDGIKKDQAKKNKNFQKLHDSRSEKLASTNVTW